MNPKVLLIYGATGYTGRLIVERALASGLMPIVAGRNGHAVESFATSLGLEWRAASLDDPAALRSMVSSGSVLLNAAGPFTTTSGPLIDACIATGTHYLDITGEVSAIEAAARSHDVAERLGVMLMPGVGFDVVPSDCLVAHVARRLPGASTLRIGFDASLAPSRGSLRTAVEAIGRGVWVRHNGALVTVTPGSLAHRFDFGFGLQNSIAVSLGDVATAFYSTGIPDIEAYMRASLPALGALTTMRTWGWLMATPSWQSFLKWQTGWLAAGPSAELRRAGWATLVVEAADAAGRCVRARLHTPEVYTFTAQCAVAVATRSLAGEWKAGFQTPSRVYGPDFTLGFEGVSREDL